MNQLLSDADIRSTCRELLASGARVTGRQLRRVLKSRFQAVGKTDRIFRIWRDERAAFEAVPTAGAADFDDSAVSARLALAEGRVEELRTRAEQAELREEAHQNRWAMEVDRLRQELLARPRYAAEIRALQDQVLRLSAELAAARGALALLSVTPLSPETPP
jgi:hypothetical protein